MPTTIHGEFKKVCAFLDLPTSGTTSELRRRIEAFSRSDEQQAPFIPSPPSSSEPGQPVLPEQYARRIFYVSFGILASVAWAAYNRRFDNCALATLLLCSSLNYWRRPRFGSWQRTADMVVSWGASGYQAFVCVPQVQFSPARAVYLATLACSGACYFRARAWGNAGDKDMSSRWHCCLHLCGNVGNFILYDALGWNAAGWT